MRLRNLLGAAVGTVGATALANRLLTDRAEGLEPILPGDSGTYRWRGFDVAYSELGDPSNPDLVLFHGIHAAASGHEFQPVVADLAEEYHVLVPDLPGFGRSDRPALSYSAPLYVAFLTEFLSDLTDHPPVVAASSLTGSFAALAAQTVDIEHLVLVCPSDGVAGGRRRPWLRTLIRSPLFGRAVFNALASKPAIRYFHADHGVADLARYPPALLDYEWRTAHQPGARFAPASFVSGYLDPEEDLEAVLTSLEVPLTLVWGRDADIVPLDQGREWADRADARLVVVDDAKLLPHVEHPATLRDLLAASITR